MANRMVVIPQEVYDNVMRPGGLLRDPVEQRLQENSAQMTKVLHSRRKPEEKYLKYDQKVKGVRGMLAQRHERPDLESLLESVLSRLRLSSPSVVSETQTDVRAAATADTQTDARSPMDVDGQPMDIVPPPPPPPAVKEVKPARSRSAPKRAVKDVPMEEEKSVLEKVREKVMRKSKQFSVADDATFSHRGSTSTLDSILRFLLGEGGDEAPPGTNALRSKLLQDAEIKKLMPNPRSEPSATRQLMNKYATVKTESSKNFKASLWKVKKEIASDGEDENRVSQKPKSNAKQTHPKFKRPVWNAY